MNQPLLLEVATRSPSKRHSNRLLVKTLKEKHGIWTHKAPHTDWLSICLPECHEILGCYVSEEGKKDPVVMFGECCRLMDEAGLVDDGYKTELEAVQAAIERISK